VNTLEIAPQILIPLSIIFIFVSMLYSSVGLGGGSTYIALLTIFEINYLLVPTIALTLNIIVTSIGIFNFLKGRFIDLRLILPFIVISIPMSYLGSSLSLPQNVFLWFLLVTLLLVVIRIYFIGNLSLDLELSKIGKIVFSLSFGAILGFIAGAVGIGGGIYLVPLIIIFNLATEKQAAAAGAIFIWFNSVAGVIARYNRGVYDFESMLPLIGAVIVGGYIGSHYGSFKFTPLMIQRTLGIVVIFAIFFISRKLVFL
jgi:uncharacterized membrane protein YfcA